MAKKRRSTKRKNPCTGCERLAKYGKLCKRHAPSDFAPLVPRGPGLFANVYKKGWRDGQESADIVGGRKGIKRTNPKRRKRKSNPSPQTMNAVLKLGMLIGVLFAIKKFVGK